MSNQTKVARKHFDVEAKAWTFSFTNGTKRVVRLDDFSDEIREQAEAAGFGHKFGDCYASAASKFHEAGYADPVSWAIDEFDAVLESLKDGDWNRAGTVGGMAYAAIAEATSKPLAEVLEVFNAMTKDAREAKLKQVRKHPQFKAIYTRMQAERAAKKVDEAEALEL